MVLETRNVGESNKLFLLFSRELGMIDASAQAVREVKSKLRFSLRDFSVSEISLVRGKQGWKITSAVQQVNYADAFGTNSSALLLTARIFSLLKRLVAGEEKNITLFEHVRSALTFVEAESLSEEELKNAECILVLSILDELGYVQKEADFAVFVGSVVWSHALLQQFAPFRAKVLVQINTSLRESHM